MATTVFDTDDFFIMGDLADVVGGATEGLKAGIKILLLYPILLILFLFIFLILLIIIWKKNNKHKKTKT